MWRHRWGGNGAESELEIPQGGAAPGISSVVACKAACIEVLPLCGGILFSNREQKCFRKGVIHVDNCHTDNELDLYKVDLPPPPAPPIPPPSPPYQPRGTAVQKINKLFRTGRPSNDIEEVGVIMHQWDGLEEQGYPWKMCLHNCMCQGAFINGRISAMIMYQGLSARPDRIGVPIPFAHRGGILIHPSAATLDCLYPIDGATYHLDNPARPGCSDLFCDAKNLRDRNGQLCGFTGAPATAWSPKDLKLLLEAHALDGAGYHGPGFHSGYNEVIINSPKYDAQLPHAVQAFFYPKGFSTVTSDLGYGIIIDVVEAHRAFLRGVLPWPNQPLHTCPSTLQLALW